MNFHTISTLYNLDFKITLVATKSVIASATAGQCTSVTDAAGKTTHTCICSLKPKSNATFCAYMLSTTGGGASNSWSISSSTA